MISIHEVMQMGLDLIQERDRAMAERDEMAKRVAELEQRIQGYLEKLTHVREPDGEKEGERNDG